MNKLCVECLKWNEERPAYALDLCVSHYERQRRGNWFSGPVRRPGKRRLEFNNDIDRFFSKVNKTDDCGLWLGGKPPSKNGYGSFSTSNPRQTVKANRWIYEQTVGPIRGHLVPICRNDCVNPGHQRDLTSSEKDRLRTDKITHCPQNHEYTPENTYIGNDGSRQCRSCLLTRSHQRAALDGDSILTADDLGNTNGWVCRLCEEPVDKDLRWPNPWSKSIDHIVPVSLGGFHEDDNLQLAHLHCNISKSNRIEEHCLKK